MRAKTTTTTTTPEKSEASSSPSSPYQHHHQRSTTTTTTTAITTTRSSLSYMQERRRLWAESRKEKITELSASANNNDNTPTTTTPSPRRRLGNRRKDRPLQEETTTTTTTSSSATTTQDDLGEGAQEKETTTTRTTALFLSKNDDKAMGCSFSSFGKQQPTGFAASAAKSSSGSQDAPPTTTMSNPPVSSLNSNNSTRTSATATTTTTHRSSAPPREEQTPNPDEAKKDGHTTMDRPLANNGFAPLAFNSNTAATFDFSPSPGTFNVATTTTSSSAVTNPFAAKNKKQPATTPFTFSLSSSTSAQPTASAFSLATNKKSAAVTENKVVLQDKERNAKTEIPKVASTTTTTSTTAATTTSSTGGLTFGETKTAAPAAPTPFSLSAATPPAAAATTTIKAAGLSSTQSNHSTTNTFASLGTSLSKDLPKATTSSSFAPFSGGSQTSTPSLFNFSSQSTTALGGSSSTQPNNGFTPSPFSTTNNNNNNTLSALTKAESWSQPPASSAQSSSYRERLVAFYKKHNPEKISNVDKTLEKHKGKEEELFSQLQRKYATYPPTTGQGATYRLDTSLGRLGVRVFSNVVPKAAANFASLCTGTAVPPANRARLTTYHNTPIHRVVPDLLIQGGDTTTGDGTGGRSAFDVPLANDMWGHFDDEEFMAHDRPGLLSMANTGPNSNSSQFFITCKALPHLNGKHVVFGEVVEGMDVVLAMVKLPIDEKQRPLREVKITDCGPLETKASGENHQSDKCRFSKVDRESNRMSESDFLVLQEKQCQQDLETSGIVQGIDSPINVMVSCATKFVEPVGRARRDAKSLSL